MTVARIRISKIRIKPAYQADPRCSGVYQLHFHKVTENGVPDYAIFSKWAGKDLGPWQMHPQGVFGRSV